MPTLHLHLSPLTYHPLPRSQYLTILIREKRFRLANAAEYARSTNFLLTGMYALLCMEPDDYVISRVRLNKKWKEVQDIGDLFSELAESLIASTNECECEARIE